MLALFLLLRILALLEAYGQEVPRIDGLPIYAILPGSEYRPSHYDPKEPIDSDEGCDLFFHEYFLQLDEFFWEKAFDLERWPIESAKADHPYDRKTCWFFCRLTLPQKYRNYIGPARFYPPPDAWSPGKISIEARNEQERIVRRVVYGERALRRWRTQKCFRAQIRQRRRAKVQRGIADCLEADTSSAGPSHLQVRADDSQGNALEEEEKVPKDWLKLWYTALVMITPDTVKYIQVGHDIAASLEAGDLAIPSNARIKVCASSLVAPRLTMVMTLWSN